MSKAVDNGLALSGVANKWQNVVTGMTLITAMTSDRIRFRHREGAENTGAAASAPTRLLPGRPKQGGGAAIGEPE